MIVTVEQYLEEARPAVEWIIPSRIPAPGWALLTGESKLGKSFLALQIAQAVAQGRPFFGHPIQPRRVLYVQADMPEGSWRERLEKLAYHGFEFGERFLIVHPGTVPPALDVLKPDGMRWLKAQVDRAGAAFVVIDVLRAIHSGDENSSQDMKSVSDALAVACQGKAVLMLHHDSKMAAADGSTNPVRSARGSSQLVGQMDTVMGLTVKQLKIVSRFDESTTYNASREESGLWTLHAAGAHTRLAEVLAFCAAHRDVPHNQLKARVVLELGMSPATYYRVLQGQACAHRAA